MRSIRYLPEQRPNDFYQRPMAFVVDNLFHRGSGISHHGAAIDEDEEITSSFENFLHGSD